ncbi:DUF4212 domain-containing protein [Halomarina pelagica]|uniref:DUF4212 domain-containing protein n=1 Tax=Halomarina pelagica TaxID=2961599 RepID=UPI0020C22C57|nr:DUF4212 domain-containing protein [Halomarina sp. BND7]
MNERDAAGRGANGADETAASGDGPTAAADGGHATGRATATGAAEPTNYLDAEVNLLSPSTPYMRDHLRIIWTGFAVWFVAVFGPVTLTAIAPDLMTTQMPVIGFPLHYFLMAIGAPTTGLLLSYWYVRKRDRLDEKYGIRHGVGGETE